MKLFRYTESINESISQNVVPTYEQAKELCSQDESPFYEKKLVVENYPVSLFNYRLAKYIDFVTPLPSKPSVSGMELRGLTFVFNTDGTLFKRYVLLEKFFNLNQSPGSMYSDVKDLTIKSISNKEDGSIASFIKLPNGKVVGKSKMGFDNGQANGINRIYKTNPDIKKFVDWSLSNDITAVFEYCAPTNRIVLRYKNEELILLRLRNNQTGEHLNIKDYLDQIGSISIAPFEDENSLDDLIEKSKTETGREGWIITFENGQMIKIKTSEYQALHGLLTDDLYRENVIIGYVLDDKIDDILGQVPEDNIETHDRINKIISIVKKALNDKSVDIEKDYQYYIKSDMSRKDYALSPRKDNPNFGFVMNMVKADDLKKMSKEEILDIYDNIEDYEKTLQRCEPYEIAKMWLRDLTKRLNLSREWLQTKDKTLFFKDSEESDDN